ncbi:MAG: hypothetical protein AB1757_21315 [Acidobacteriota bacterium]
MKKFSLILIAVILLAASVRANESSNEVTMRQTVAVRANIQELQSNAVSALIGPVRLAAIQAIDATPMFVEMTVGHEGVSRGEIVGLGAKAKEWGKRVIRRLSELLNPSGRNSAQIFDGGLVYHGNQDARTPCGEVVHSRTTEESGLMTSKAVGYIYEGEIRELIRSGERDVCSVEAEVEIVEEGGRHFVEDVLNATAVVLGDSRKQTPGFAGARVALITEFMPDGGASGGDDPPPATPPATPPAPPPATSQLTKEQLVQAIKDAGITAADLGIAPPPAPTVTQPTATPPATPPATASTLLPPAAPPEKPPQATSETLDLSSPEFNEFLPKEVKYNG